ncbi:cupin domain-containing protein [Iningainema tapete]|uniref:Cupin domain-containing protein n=1 Tax=Iningainema tapete BLCC-T55 TaxID=2748662 RepID=A0A8J7BZD8_9CYAN|nr:cupin domain-containing protein [Iningainema tapete]MBD2777422.1 cupin domain-containing protein [Iningainema tapete BLCC-T55]
MNISQDGLVVRPEKGAKYSVVGDLVTFKAVGEDTGGKYALFEIVFEPQISTPPHIHSREDESFYILEGEMEFQLDEQTVVATPGTFIHSPKGQRHSFKNTSTTAQTKMLCWAIPSGIEHYFAEVGTRVEDACTSAPPINPAAIEIVVTTAPKYGIQIIPPAANSVK